MSYADLRRQITSAGLLQRSGWNYLGLTSIILILGGVSAVLVAFAPGAWELLAVPTLTMCMMQIGFIGHDAGHNQVFPKTTHNRILGQFCFPFLLGMSFRTWVIKHNLHHAETNVLDVDPDIQSPVLAFTEEAARQRRGIALWITRYQAFMFPVLTLFATVGFRIDAWSYVVGRRSAQLAARDEPDVRQRELLFLVANVLLSIVVPSLLVGPGRWLPVFLLAQLLLGTHMAFAFAPNHKAMPMFTEANKPSFLTQQVLSSRNVRGGPIIDFLYGGLNYQIEHHLFPTMPRCRLGASQKVVAAHCHQIGLDYTEDSVVGTWHEIFKSLHELGKIAGQPARPVEHVAV